MPMYRVWRSGALGGGIPGDGTRGLERPGGQRARLPFRDREIVPRRGARRVGMRRAGPGDSDGGGAAARHVVLVRDRRPWLRVHNGFRRSKIGRAACREKECMYEYIWVGAGP